MIYTLPDFDITTPVGARQGLTSIQRYHHCPAINSYHHYHRLPPQSPPTTTIISPPPMHQCLNCHHSATTHAPKPTVPLLSTHSTTTTTTLGYTSSIIYLLTSIIHLLAVREIIWHMITTLGDSSEMSYHSTVTVSYIHTCIYDIEPKNILHIDDNRETDLCHTSSFSGSVMLHVWHACIVLVLLD